MMMFWQEKILSETVRSRWNWHADEASISDAEYTSSYVYVTFLLLCLSLNCLLYVTVLQYSHW